MSLYDVINDISEKKIIKTETGDNRIYGVVVGIVAKNYDKNMPGRVCVTIPTRDENANELKWARLSQPSGGGNWGHYFLPEIGDQVLLIFEGGHIEKPYVIGCIPKDNNKFLLDSIREKNDIKRVVTKNGNKIEFFDNSKDSSGNKDKLTISTAKDKHNIILDNEENLISICDKSKENSISINTKDGELNINIKNKININVGSVKISIDGKTGNISINSNQLNVKTKQKIDLKTDGAMSLKATTLQQKATSMNKVESGGITIIQGTPIKIG